MQSVLTVKTETYPEKSLHCPSFMSIDLNCQQLYPRCDRISSDRDSDYRLRFDELEHCVLVRLPSTSLFANKLVQNVLVRQSSNLSANELVLSKTNWYKTFQFILPSISLFAHKLEL